MWFPSSISLKLSSSDVTFPTPHTVTDISSALTFHSLWLLIWGLCISLIYPPLVRPGFYDFRLKLQIHDCCYLARLISCRQLQCPVFVQGFCDSLLETYIGVFSSSFRACLWAMSLCCFWWVFSFLFFAQFYLGCKRTSFFCLKLKLLNVILCNRDYSLFNCPQVRAYLTVFTKYRGSHCDRARPHHPTPSHTILQRQSLSQTILQRPSLSYNVNQYHTLFYKVPHYPTTSHTWFCQWNHTNISR